MTSLYHCVLSPSTRRRCSAHREQMSGDGTMMHWLTMQGDRLVAAIVENAAALTIDFVLTGLLV